MPPLLERTASAVGCSHCQQLGATLTCTSCGRPVCPACAASWESCPERHARCWTLGLGRRLRSVDPEGRFGLAYGWSRRPLLVDLGLGRAIETERLLPHLAGPWPVLLPGGRVLQADLGAGATVTNGLYLVEPWPGGSVHHLLTRNATGPPRWIGISDDGTLGLLLTSDETVEVVDLARAALVNTIADAGQMIHAVAASASLDLVAVGSYERVALFRCGSRRRLSEARVGLGTIHGVALAGSKLVVLDERGYLEVHVLNESRDALAGRLLRMHLGFPAPPTASAWGSPRLSLISSSPDGEALAVASGRDVTVFSVEGGPRHELPSRPDDVVYVRFVRGGDLLVTGDADNRVVLWPRDRGSFVERVVERDLDRTRAPCPPELRRGLQACTAPTVCALFEGSEKLSASARRSPRP